MAILFGVITLPKMKKCKALCGSFTTQCYKYRKGRLKVSRSMVNTHMDTELKKVSQNRRIPFEIMTELPRDVAFQAFMKGINGFTDDCYADGRELNILPAEREELTSRF